MRNKLSYEALEKEAEKLEADLKYVHAFELIVQNISTTFINMPPESIDSGINDALKIISEFIDSVRSSIFLISDCGKKAYNTHEWCQDLSHSIINTFDSIPVGAFGYFQEKIWRRQFIIVNSENDLPLKAISEREWFKLNGDRPLLVIPMILKKRVFGFLAFSAKNTIKWSKELIGLIQIVADRFTNIIHRKKIELQLINSKNISDALLNATTDSAMLLNTRGDILAINESFAKRFGKQIDEMFGENIYNYFSIEISQFRRGQIESVIRTAMPVQFEDENNNLILKNIIYPVFDTNNRVEKVAFYSHDITDLKNAEKSIRYLTSELIKAQENERQKIACDLHDNVAQELACLRINCESIAKQFPDIPDSVQSSISDFSKSIKNSIDTVRDLAYELQPPVFEEMGLIKTIYGYCEEFTIKNGVLVDLYSAGMEAVSLGFDTENNIHRIIQEALNNVKNHSEATHVTIRLVATYPNIILRIEDNGKGFNVVKKLSKSKEDRKLGLRSMEGRAKLQNGKLKIISRKNEGTKLFIEIPYSETEIQPVKTEEYYPLFKN